jgi:sugar phosphate isomerase/epimerase
MATAGDILARVSYHAVYDASILDALRYAKDSGFAGVQAAIEMPHLSPSSIEPSGRRAIRAFCDKNGTRLSLHAHDDMASLLEPDSHLSGGIMEYFSTMLRFAEDTGAWLITLHAGAVPHFRTDTEPSQQLPAASEKLYRAALERNLGRLVEMNHGGVTICIENNKLCHVVCEVLQPYTSRGEISLCWDIAKHHMAKTVDDKLTCDFMLDNISSVRQVHLHDVRNSRSHMVIGTGEVDFASYLAMLPEGQVEDYCIEVRPREKALESMRNVRSALADTGVHTA